MNKIPSIGFAGFLWVHLFHLKIEATAAFSWVFILNLSVSHGAVNVSAILVLFASCCASVSVASVCMCKFDSFILSHLSFASFASVASSPSTVWKPTLFGVSLLWRRTYFSFKSAIYKNNNYNSNNNTTNNNNQSDKNWLLHIV